MNFYTKIPRTKFLQDNHFVCNVGKNVEKCDSVHTLRID